MFKKKLISTLWILLGVAAIGLLFIGAKKKSEKLCKGINLEVSENAKQVFIDEQGIKNEVAENGGKPGVAISDIDLRNIETQLRKDPWIKDVKLYFDNNQLLQVDLKETDPIARIFTLNGSSFFIDSSKNYLPTNRNVLARVPVFTGFTSNKQKLSAPDSALLQQVKEVAQFVIGDSVWMAFVSQVNITSDATFQIVPVVGNAIISIGNADDLPGKFDRLYSFYRQVLSKTGINKYRRIDVQYNGQVVAANGIDSVAKNTPAQVSVSTDTTKKRINNIVKPLPKTAAAPGKPVKQATHIPQKKKQINLHKATKKPQQR